MTAHDTLRAAGYRWTTELALGDDDIDAQGHLNNAAIARACNDLRIGYVRSNLGPRWIDWLRSSGSVVVAREVHLSYDSEGFPGERFVGATRILRRDGRAAIIEQQIGEYDTGRTIARAWVVQLLVNAGAVIDWPDFYWPLVESVEERPIPRLERAPRAAFGPPAWPERADEPAAPGVTRAWLPRP